MLEQLVLILTSTHGNSPYAAVARYRFDFEEQPQDHGLVKIDARVRVASVEILAVLSAN